MPTVALFVLLGCDSGQPALRQTHGESGAPARADDRPRSKASSPGPTAETAAPATAVPASASVGPAPETAVEGAEMTDAELDQAARAMAYPIRSRKACESTDPVAGIPELCRAVTSCLAREVGIRHVGAAPVCPDAAAGVAASTEGPELRATVLCVPHPQQGWPAVCLAAMQVDGTWRAVERLYQAQGPTDHFDVEGLELRQLVPEGPQELVIRHRSVTVQSLLGVALDAVTRTVRVMSFFAIEDGKPVYKTSLHWSDTTEQRGRSNRTSGYELGVNFEPPGAITIRKVSGHVAGFMRPLLGMHVLADLPMLGPIRQ